MKDMTQEDKAKRYDEALKVLHKYDGINIMFTQDLKEEMFPELREEYEDERIRKALIRFHKSTIDVDGIKGEDIIVWLEKQGDTQKKIDYAYQKGYDDGLRVNLEMQSEQKPAKWSKEDESLRLRTIGALVTCKIGSPTKCVDEQINWLKSLNPQSHWKPSDEQMITLEHYMHTLVCNSYKEILFSLYQDLKKLREE